MVKIRIKRYNLELTPWNVVLGVIAVAVVWFVFQRVFFAPTATERIEKLLESAADAAADESLFRLSDVFTLDYQDASGMDRSALMGMAQRFFAEADQIHVKIVRVMHENKDLPRDATEARAIVILQVSGEEVEGKEKFSGISSSGGEVFEVRFRQDRRVWKVSYSRHLREATPEGLMRELKGTD